ncbi:SDR family NAD(P)-dependent oxidoreductase [Kitasatospora azatica]|uniref:SDR family NAD(P)-dependent oxidoreductase n=1 Tax=Kitasatospora azatica TaxID=58347 RepID=UPI00056B44AE|nr:SDR family NAD(P)-dependent oxidoreductase [Kitasatospora azatica]
MNTSRQTRFGPNSTAAEVVAGHDLSGTTAVVTGAASGIGVETARALAGAGARVLVAARDAARGEATAADIRRSTGNPQVAFELLDLASLRSVREFAARYLADGRPLHLLVNNAGVMATPFGLTEDGFELQFGTNHLGHFTLTTALLPALRAAGGARVVSLSSRAHGIDDVHLDDPNFAHRRYDPWAAYGQSKTANMLFAVGLTNRHAAEGITSNAVMPGVILSPLWRHTPQWGQRRQDADGRIGTPPGWKTAEQGAATSVWAAVAAELQGVGGRYLDDCAVARPWPGGGSMPGGHYRPYALDPDRAEALWRLSETLVAG